MSETQQQPAPDAQRRGPVLEIDRIEIEPAPNRYFDDDAVAPRDQPTEPGSPQSALAVAYAERLARYERDLDAGAQLRFGSPARDRYARHAVELPGQPIEEVLYDGALDRRLLRVYALGGWEGIRSVAAALERAANAPRTRNLRPWRAIKDFFHFTRNQLFLRIRLGLINIERRAADEIVLQLSLTASLVNEAWAQLDIKISDTNRAGKRELIPSTRASPSLDTPVYEPRTFYRLGNRLLSTKLHQAIARAIQARDDIAWHLAERDRLHQDLQQFRDEAGPSTPSGMERDLADTERWLEEHANDLNLFYGDVYTLCKVAVLVVPLLKLPLTQPDLEQTLGEVLVHFHGEAERIAQAFAATESWLTAALPASKPGQTLEQLEIGNESPERTALFWAIDRASSSQPKYLGLLSDRTLDALVEKGTIARDTFDWVVLSHYKTELIVEVETRRQTAELIESVVGLLNQEAALLSLALWALPVGRVARGVSKVLGLGLVVYQAYSVVHQLAILDDAIAVRLIETDRREVLQVAYVGELARMRSDFLDQLTREVLKEVSLIVMARAWPEFKTLLHLRGYYTDLEILVGT